MYLERVLTGHVFISTETGKYRKLVSTEIIYGDHTGKYRKQVQYFISTGQYLERACVFAYANMRICETHMRIYFRGASHIVAKADYVGKY